MMNLNLRSLAFWRIQGEESYIYLYVMYIYATCAHALMVCS
mgnify:FL=1